MKDWTQEDPTKEEVENYLRDLIKSGKYQDNSQVALDAFEFFDRPYHINVLVDMVQRIKKEGVFHV